VAERTPVREAGRGPFFFEAPPDKSPLPPSLCSGTLSRKRERGKKERAVGVRLHIAAGATVASPCPLRLRASATKPDAFISSTNVRR